MDSFLHFLSSICCWQSIDPTCRLPGVVNQGLCFRALRACVVVFAAAGMVRGATKSLVIDLGFVLEGQRPEELPEALLGAFRLNHLDCTQAKRIDTTRELPLLPRPLQQHQLSLLAAAKAAGGGSAAAATAPESAAAEAADAPGSGLAVCWQGDAQRRACSASGAMPGAAAAGGGAGDTARQQHAQQQQPAGEQPGQAREPSRARNSASIVESGRTMTGHARSR